MPLHSFSVLTSKNLDTEENPYLGSYRVVNNARIMPDIWNCCDIEGYGGDMKVRFQIQFELFSSKMMG